MIALILANKLMIVSVLFGISEALSMIPQVKANGVFQLVFNGLQKAKAALTPAQS